MTPRIHIALGVVSGLFLGLGGVVLARREAPPAPVSPEKPIDFEVPAPLPTRCDPPPAAGTPLVLDASDRTLVYWAQMYDDALRRIWGASVNALANAPATMPPLQPREAWDAMLKQIPPENLACSICTQLSISCTSPDHSRPVLKATALPLQQSTFALRNERLPRKDQLAAGGPTCGQLLGRACADCAGQGSP